VAPPGYGKTTLLSQWAERTGRAFAWVSVDERDNDPNVLLTYIAAALDAVQPVGGGVFDLLASPRPSVPGSAVRPLAWAFSAMTLPVALVLDGVDALVNPECLAAVSVLADHVPGGSRLVLAGRDVPPRPIARLHAAGKITQIGPRDLAFSREEASSLLRNARVAVGADEVAELYRRTEGWPAGLCLAALYLREGGPAGNAASFGGDDRLVSEYIESEFLARISERQRVFLARTAVLERMCSPLCEALVGGPGSAATLACLARSNMLLVPLDQQGEWYRYHHLFRDMLVAELERLEPNLMPLLRRRAAGWCARNGLPEEALEYSIAAGDVDAAADLVGRLGVSAYRQGRRATLQRWLRWLGDQGGVGIRPMITAQTAVLTALTGRPAEAEQWADVVDRWTYRDGARRDDPSAEAWAALLRAMLCRGGIEQMRADADEAVRRFAEIGFVTPKPALVRGIARVLSGDLDGGEASLEDAVSIGRKTDSPEILATALCEWSLVAMARGEWSRAEVLAGQGRAVLGRAGIEESFAMVLACAAQARAAVHRGDAEAARRKLGCVQRLWPELTHALPCLAVQARIELVRVYIGLADLAAAGALIREVNALLWRRPALGSLAGEVGELQAQLSQERVSITLGESALTGAELRLLPMLATHLSFPQIAGEMFLSRNTIKSEAMSIYRKLGASSRNQAVERARVIGLLGGDAPGRAGGEVPGGPAPVTDRSIPDAALSAGMRPAGVG
jgi:LuxR family maltose regulon positive regulatory protein